MNYRLILLQYPPTYHEPNLKPKMMVMGYTTGEEAAFWHGG